LCSLDFEIHFSQRFPLLDEFDNILLLDGLGVVLFEPFKVLLEGTVAVNIALNRPIGGEKLHN